MRSLHTHESIARPLLDMLHHKMSLKLLVSPEGTAWLSGCSLASSCCLCWSSSSFS